MHPIIHRDRMQAQIADLHRQAQGDAWTRAAARARRARPHHRSRRLPGHTVTGLPRRILTLFGAHSPTPTR